MKFGYSYKTSDGVRHEKTYIAANREEVFTALRERGIRPIKVWEIGGVMRWLRGSFAAVGVIGIFLGLGAIGYAYYSHEQLVEDRKERAKEVVKQVEDRSQIYGDPGILQTCEARSWANVFEDEGERFLARFAQPGRVVHTAGNAWRGIVAAALKAKMEPVKVLATDGAEVAKMKRMVNGMKLELANYIQDGGTVEEYIDEVLERQNVEEKIVANFQAEFDRLEKSATKENRDETIEKWNAKNVLLRQMGLRTVLLPEALEE